MLRGLVYIHLSEMFMTFRTYSFLQLKFFFSTQNLLTNATCCVNRACRGYGHRKNSTTGLRASEWNSSGYCMWLSGHIISIVYTAVFIPWRYVTGRSSNTSQMVKHYCLWFIIGIFRVWISALWPVVLTTNSWSVNPSRDAGIVHNVGHYRFILYPF